MLLLEGEESRQPESVKFSPNRTDRTKPSAACVQLVRKDPATRRFDRRNNAASLPTMIAGLTRETPDQRSIRARSSDRPNSLRGSSGATLLLQYPHVFAKLGRHFTPAQERDLDISKNPRLTFRRNR